MFWNFCKLWSIAQELRQNGIQSFVNAEYERALYYFINDVLKVTFYDVLIKEHTSRTVPCYEGALGVSVAE